MHNSKGQLDISLDYPEIPILGTNKFVHGPAKKRPTYIVYVKKVQTNKREYDPLIYT